MCHVKLRFSQKVAPKKMEDRTERIKRTHLRTSKTAFKGLEGRRFSAAV